MPDWLRTLVWDGCTLLVLAAVFAASVVWLEPDRADD
jgi:hypothetical protein